MTLLSESRERFLLAIAAQVSPARIEEIHFFQPIRQSGVESGVAVVAARPEVELVGEASLPAAPSVAEVLSDEVEAKVPPDEPIDENEPLPDDTDGEAVVAAETVDEVAGEVAGEGGDEIADESLEDEPVVVERAPRLVVYTARYRQTLKGIDRGKWEASVVAEADAPLVTIDAVVRGVQRRSGDRDDATRMEGDEIRAFIAGRRAAAANAVVR